MYNSLPSAGPSVRPYQITSLAVLSSSDLSTYDDDALMPSLSRIILTLSLAMTRTVSHLACSIGDIILWPWLSSFRMTDPMDRKNLRGGM